MEYIKPIIPDGMRKKLDMPTRRQEQRRQCTRIINANLRALDKQIKQCQNSERQAVELIKQSSKRAQTNPSQARQAAMETRLFARELVRARKQTARITTSRAQLNSVSMQVEQAFRMNSMQINLERATGIMKGVNTLIQMPELTGTMRELSQELMKADIVQEMTEDMMPSTDLIEGEDEEAEYEVSKVLGEVLKTPGMPEPKVSQPVLFEPEPLAAGEQEETLAQMRGRLEALKS